MFFGKARDVLSSLVRKKKQCLYCFQSIPKPHESIKIESCRQTRAPGQSATGDLLPEAHASRHGRDSLWDTTT